MKNQRVLVAMSGGVDSSVAAALLVQAGYECAGVSLQLIDDAQQSVTDAHAVCQQLGIEHYKLDRRELFARQVLEPFVRAYLAGITPNPCISCNRFLKFGELLEWALARGFDCLATGHYVRLVDGQLLRARDSDKDQSYVLYNLSSKQLQSLRFPLGELTKAEVRELARTWNLASANKAESQDICFVANSDYAAFIESYLCQTGLGHDVELPSAGNILNLDGEVLGRHQGIHHYTIGQRHGLGVSGPEPYYVLDIDAAQAVVIVAKQAERGRQTAFIDDLNTFVPVAALAGRDLSAKHRYRGREHLVRVFPQENLGARIEFAQKQLDLTRGQALVLYDGDRVVAGGTITGWQ